MSSAVTSHDTSLPELRRTGDSYMLAATLFGAAGLVWLGGRFGQLGLGAALAGSLLAVAALLYMVARGSWFNSVAYPILLAGVVAAQIHITQGRAEYHFGAFVVLAYALVYRHWLPLLATAGAIAVHHVVFDRLQALGWPVWCQARPDLLGVLEQLSYLVSQAGFSVMMARQMRQESHLAAELDSITSGLSATPGKVDFTTLAGRARTEAGGRLLGVLRTVRDATSLARRTAGTVSVASSEIASGNQDLSTRTEQAAADLQRTAAALEQLTATVRESSDTVGAASQRASEAARRAAEGETAADQLAGSMQAISESSRRVSEITSVIDGIAFQTNILALNAAVEAARAGEQGRGFAVVAGEVRTLAQRSGEAAREIRQLITRSVETVEAGSRQVDVAKGVIDEVVTGMGRVAGLIAELSQASNEQREGIVQVNHAVTEIDQMTQQNAALVEEAAAAAGSLRDQSRRLAETVAVFRTGD